MKLLIICVLFFLSWSLATVAQTNKLVEQGKQWSVMYSLTLAPAYTPTVKTEIYVIDGDSTINNTLYKKMYSTGKEDLTGMSLFACIRQDGEKVYTIYARAKDEILSFDFGLQVGDTIIVNNIVSDVLKVVSVDEIVMNGITRKCISLEYGGEIIDKWVEGIGSLWSGAYVNRFTTGSESTLLCCHQGEDIIYMNEEYNDCYIEYSTGTESVQADDSFTVRKEKEGWVLKGEKNIVRMDKFDSSGMLINSKQYYSNQVYIPIAVPNVLNYVKVYFEDMTCRVVKLIN